MVAKKTPAKKAPVKKAASKKPVRKATSKRTTSKKSAPMKSFRVYKDDQSFNSFRITRQTVYWTILLLFIIATQLWLLKIQLDIADLTNALLAE